MTNTPGDDQGGQDAPVRILLESEDATVLDRGDLTDYILFGLRGERPEGFFVYRHSSSAFLHSCLVGMLAELCLNAGKNPEELESGFMSLDAHRERIPNISYLALSQMEPLADGQVFSAFIGNSNEKLLDFDDVTMYVMMGKGEAGPASSFCCDGAFLMGAVAEGADQLSKMCQVSYQEVIWDVSHQAKACLQE